MSSVQSSEVVKNRLLPDGRRRIVYLYTLLDNSAQESEVFVGPFHRSGGWDVQGNLIPYGDNLLGNMKEEEVRELFLFAQTPLSDIGNLTAHQSEIFNRVESPKWTIKKRLQKHLIYAFMRRLCGDYALSIKLVYDDLPTANAPLENRLDITPAQRSKLQAKASEFYGTPATAKSSVLIMSTTCPDNSDDWGIPL